LCPSWIPGKFPVPANALENALALLTADAALPTKKCI